MRPALCLILLFSVSSQPDAANPTSDGAMGLFIRGVSDLLDAGPDLWAKIEKYQATGNVQTVVSGAVSIEGQKAQLRNDILNSQIPSSAVLQSRIQNLNNQVLGFQSSLQRFAYEIDSSSKNAALDLRAASDMLLGSKGVDLTKVVQDWKPNDRNAQVKAADDLNAAIRCSDDAARVAACLQKSIHDGKRDTSPECTVPAIKKIGLSCPVLR